MNKPLKVTGQVPGRVVVRAISVPIARPLAYAVAIATCGWLAAVGCAYATLPDERHYELVSPVEKNGLIPYAAVPAFDGGAVNFEARGAFAAANTGSLNVYQAIRTAFGWQISPLTPAPTKPLGSLEEQAPVWFSPDLLQTIFTTPESYTPGDQDQGALDLYMRDADGGLTWVSQGTQGSTSPSHATFDGATVNGHHVVFSSAASLVAAATELSLEAFPEADYLYERDLPSGPTHLLSLDSAGHPAGYAETTLAEEAPAHTEFLTVARSEGFFDGERIVLGSGQAAETLEISAVKDVTTTTERLRLITTTNNAYPADTLVTHVAEGTIFGDGAHLASGSPPASEYLPANSGSGSTTNAISSDGSKVFFETPSPDLGEPVGLYMRRDNAATVKIAGAKIIGPRPTATIFAEETTIFGTARYEGAAANGSLMFFTSEEGLASEDLAGSPTGTELYEFNTTEHAIGSTPPLSARSVSAGLKGNQTPVTTLTAGVTNGAESLTVASTAGFSAGEMIAVRGPWEVRPGEVDIGYTAVIASVASATELILTRGVPNSGKNAPPGTVVHGVHSASMVAASSDGSRVYFISDGILSSNANAYGATAIAVKPNLYVYDTTTDETTFIGTVAESDVKTPGGNPKGLSGEPDISRPAVPTPGGGVLVFASAADLTGQNPWQEFAEIYRYTVAGNKLECLSCTAPGVKPTGNANFGETAGGTYDPPGLTSPMSEDGSRVFFDTPDSLVPEDTNGSAPQSAKFGTPTSTDVYEAEGGNVYLISSGKATTPTVLQGTTPSGNDVLFTTTANLAPQDTDGGYENVWDARVGGGFPAEGGGGQPTCVGASCRAAFGVAPVFSSPASTTPQSAGNPPATVVKPKPKQLICRKGLVKRRLHGKVICARKSSRSAPGGHGARRAVAFHLHRRR